jgi:proline dehydrogenase
MLDTLARFAFGTLAHSATLAAWASRTGMREHGVARRFVGGETTADAVAVATDLDRRGFKHTLNHLGEHVRSAEATRRATAEWLDVVRAVTAAGLESKVSIKLSQIGLELDQALCVENLRQILAAVPPPGFVRIDMEGSRFTDQTFAVLDAVWAEGTRNVGVVLQAYLHRSADDLTRLVKQGVRIRLCKGAYNEPSSIAYAEKRQVDEAFLRFMRLLLTEGVGPAIATHDERMIEATRAFARECGRPPADFEFQMLYGVRRDLQERLREEGYVVRIYVPCGPELFAYFMRRLGERPANVASVVRSLFGERASP